MIPRDTFDDVVLGNPIVIKSDSSDPGGIVVDLSGDVDAVVGEDGNKVPSEVIVADGGNGGSLDTVLRDVIDEVGGCASRFCCRQGAYPTAVLRRRLRMVWWCWAW